MANNALPQPGFTLPQPSTGAVASTEAAPPATQLAVNVDLDLQGPAPRDMLIGGAVLLLLMVAFFFAKNAYAHHLVAKRHSPSSANAAGWWLWVFLTLLSVAAVLGVMSRSILLTPFVVGPLALGALVSLVLMALASRR